MMGLFYIASVLQFVKNIISCLQIVGRYISYISVSTTGLQDIFPMRVRIPLPR